MKSILESADDSPAAGIFAGLPRWVRIVWALGFPSAIAIVLLYAVLVTRDAQYKAILAEEKINQQLLMTINTQIADSAKTMHTFAIRSSARDEALVQLLFRLCLSTTNTPSEREACYAAMSRANEP